MKKLIPLWFADIIGTENKLSKLSENGFHMTDFSPVTGVFTFEEGEKHAERYRICYAKKCGGKVPKGLAANGWDTVCSGNNHYVVRHDDVNIENVPSYSFWKTLNRIFLWLWIMVLCFVGGFYGGAFAAALDNGDKIIGNPFFAPATVILAIAVVCLVITAIANRKLAKTDVDLNLGGGKVIKTVPMENFIYTPDEEKQMLKNGTMIKKTPLGWFYAPDKAEEMVEKMAREGWKFYRFDNMGVTFYFIKSEPCNMKFVVDMQSEATDEYFIQSKDDGWKLEFTSVTRWQSFVIWSKLYDDDDEIPEFYTDYESTLKRAKRMAITLGIPMSVIALMAVAFVVICFTKLTGEELVSGIAVVAIYIVVAVEYIIFGSRAIGYYLRVKQNQK